MSGRSFQFKFKPSDLFLAQFLNFAYLQYMARPSRILHLSSHSHRSGSCSSTKKYPLYHALSFTISFVLKPASRFAAVNLSEGVAEPHHFEGVSQRGSGLKSNGSDYTTGIIEIHICKKNTLRHILCRTI
jgi:hypothetical protein